MTPRGPAPSLLGYIRRRLPLVPVSGPLLLAGASFSAVCAGRLPPELGEALAWLAVLMSFSLLFLQLRLIDDLDDLQDDRKEDTDAALAARRRFLTRNLVLLPVALLALNAARPAAVGVIVVATVLAYLGPFVVKRYLPPRPVPLALAFVVFEGAPAAIFAYLYVFWNLSVDTAAPVGVLGAAAFWLAYEFWKFSRKLHQDTLQPYLLRLVGLKQALTAMLLSAFVVNALFAYEAGFTPLTRSLLSMLPLAFLMGVRRSLPMANGAVRRPRSAPPWSGMTYMFALSLGVTAELARPERWS